MTSVRKIQTALNFSVSGVEYGVVVEKKLVDTNPPPPAPLVQDVGSEVVGGAPVPGHAEGQNSDAGPVPDHAEGQNPDAGPVPGHAEGQNQDAGLVPHHAEGQNPDAGPVSGHADLNLLVSDNGGLLVLEYPGGDDEDLWDDVLELSEDEFEDDPPSEEELDEDQRKVISRIVIRAGPRRLVLKATTEGTTNTVYSTEQFGMEDSDIYPFFLNWFEVVMSQDLENMNLEDLVNRCELHNFAEIFEHNLGEALLASVQMPGGPGGPGDE